MIHPDIRIKWISNEKGYGLFASKMIPKGTITFIQDDLDLVIADDSLPNYRPEVKEIIERYSYQDSNNNHIVSWDLGKFMNHCCFANTLSTGYGFEIAIRDIKKNEEVTDDYRLFSKKHHIKVSCGKKDCIGEIHYKNIDQLIPNWDKEIFQALRLFRSVSQPLVNFLSSETEKELSSHILSHNFKSVREQIPRDVAQ